MAACLLVSPTSTLPIPTWPMGDDVAGTAWCAKWWCCWPA
eukprot:CAMPEP_0172031094 /NCGR_PEP_ID=MMETSP1041-20130122/19100_1 /TAXON_ID=464988 /ORGANISM="Hemiselmis andersenii, Strain CCMP439" /LENGTH=39 /DNA_ID= /DNA_START= /DNA_END= /DNA_ORIENTATION=